ncbi:MAG: U32 family peptidase [Muribaculaceae bacterium]|nr:U32 family peptidase [Muribaculaceae bacterium]
MRSLELLAPARDAAVGRIAVLAGADAVYIGAPAFGARAAATNTVDDIAGLVDFAHRFRVKVYVTMNTIVFDDEIADVEALVWKLYSAGVDALIVQDMAYLEMDLPPIALHASTQCDIRTPEKARMLADAGFSQLVLPREFSLAQIREARDAAGIPVEVFVHGALCVSYSGDCQAGYVAMGRSANRGVCPQMCRLPYALVDSSGREVAPPRHYLSLRDLNQSRNLAALVEAGASSFKIEGRLKDARYVANVVSAYSQLLDRIVADSDGLYCRAAAGVSECGFGPDLSRTFNRGYTSYFLTPAAPAAKMASLDTPKWVGVPVGKVTAPYDARRGFFTATTETTLANGDGLGYFDKSRKFNGFRLNRADGGRLYPAQPLNGLTVGTVLYRNGDKAFNDILDRPDAGCTRRIPVAMTVSAVDDSRIALTVADVRGCSATVVVDSPYAPAKADQHEPRHRTLAKLGDTIYELASLDDKLGDRFVPASVLTAARRELIALLDADALCTYLSIIHN